jgi:hypothetical protein
MVSFTSTFFVVELGGDFDPWKEAHRQHATHVPRAQEEGEAL